jgi:hypothetical protein
MESSIIFPNKIQKYPSERLILMEIAKQIELAYELSEDMDMDMVMDPVYRSLRSKEENRHHEL